MAADLALYLTGGAANADPRNSLGGERSAHPAPADLWDDVDPGECRTGDVEHRALDLVNAGDQTARQVEFWAESPWALWVGTSGLKSRLKVRDEGQAPPGVGFLHGGAIGLPEIPPGQGVRVWLRRTIAPGAGAAGASAVLRWRYL